MEGFSNRTKIERMVNNYFGSCNLEQLKNIAKDLSQLLVAPTGQTVYTMALKLHSGTILLLKGYGFEGFSNQNQIYGLVSNHLSRCNSSNSQQLKEVYTNIAKNCSQDLVTPIMNKSLMLWPSNYITNNPKPFIFSQG